MAHAGMGEWTGTTSLHILSTLSLPHVLGLQDGVFSSELFSNRRHRRPGSTWLSVVDVLAVVAKTGLRLGERR
jgi:hypothetical protein